MCAPAASCVVGRTRANGPITQSAPASQPSSTECALTMVPAPSFTLRSTQYGPIWTSSANATSPRSEEHTSELQSLMRISYAVFCLKKNNHPAPYQHTFQRLLRIHINNTATH